MTNTQTPLEHIAKRLGIDAQGGDILNGQTACERTTKAAKHTARLIPNSDFILIGEPKDIKKHLGWRTPKNVHVQDMSALDSLVSETELEKTRRKHTRRIQKFGAIFTLAKLLKHDKIDGIYTIGNTKKVTPIVATEIGIMPEYKTFFPEDTLIPLLAEVPKAPTVRRASHYYLIDAGSIPDLTTPQQFLLYAKLGMMYAKAVGGIEHPTVALSNIGREKEKGDKVIREAYRLLEQELSGAFVGNVEAHSSSYELEKGTDEHIHADVVVSRGAVGNATIKALATGAYLVSDTIKHEIKNGSLLEKLCGWFLNRNGSVFYRVNQRLGPGQHGGAAYLCLNQPVFKNHGTATQTGLINGYQKALHYIDENVTAKIRDYLTQEQQRAA